MTIDLDPIYTSNSQLFYTEVYDIDGVTKLTPQSCVCSVFNQDTNAAIVTDQAPWIFLWLPQDIYGISRRIAGWQPQADSRINLHRVRIVA